MRYWIKFGLLALVLVCLAGCARIPAQEPESIAETLQPAQEPESAEEPETEPEVPKMQQDVPEADFLMWAALRAETTAEEGVPEEELLKLLVTCECGLVNDGFTFDDPAQLRAGQLYLARARTTDSFTSPRHSSAGRWIAGCRAMHLISPPVTATTRTAA